MSGKKEFQNKESVRQATKEALNDENIYDNDDIIYSPQVINVELLLKMNECSPEILNFETSNNVLLYKVQKIYEGVYNAFGYIKPMSSKIISVSIPVIEITGDVKIRVTLSCLICDPVSGTVVNAKIISKTKAGLLADLPVKNGVKTPLKIYIVREYEISKNNNLDKYNVGDIVKVELQRTTSKLSDDMCHVLGKLVMSD